MLSRRPLIQVTISGAVEGKAVWPSKLKPVAWHKDADRVRMKLGLYHKVDQVHDGKVEYRDISIKSPKGEAERGLAFPHVLFLISGVLLIARQSLVDSMGRKQSILYKKIVNQAQKKRKWRRPSSDLHVAAIGPRGTTLRNSAVVNISR